MNSQKQTQPNPVKPKITSIEAKAYFLGTQGVGVENFLAEVSADFARLKEQTVRNCSDKVKNREAKAAVSKNLRNDAESRRAVFSGETGGKKPALLVYVLAVLFALSAVFAEAWFLKPVLQGWNIVENYEQFIVSLIFVFGLGAAAKITVNHFLKATQAVEKNPNNWIVFAVFGALFLALSVYLGDFRAAQMILQTKLAATDNAALMGALENGYYTNLVLSILGTIILPLTSSIALAYGADGFRYQRQWRSARRDWLKFAKRCESFDKTLQAEIEKRDKTLAEIDERRNSWLEAIKQAHLEGYKCKARRRSVWSVAILIGGGSALILAAAMTLFYLFVEEGLASVAGSEVGRFAVYLSASIGFMLLFAYYAWNRWNNPSPEQLYRQRTVIWHQEKEPVSSLNEVVAVPHQLKERIAGSDVAEKAKTNGKVAETF